MSYEVAGRDSDRIDARPMTTARDIGLSHRIFTGRDNKPGCRASKIKLQADGMSVSSLQAVSTSSVQTTQLSTPTTGLYI
jgi:hypothetical protein